MTDKIVKALVLAGYGMNCDYESQYVLRETGAETDRLHVNRVIQLEKEGRGLSEYQIMVVGGGFAYADDHGAGVLLGLKLRAHLGEAIDRFIADGKLIIGICNGFQALVNMGLLPGFDGDYHSRGVALTANECGNFRNDWVHLKVESATKCVFTKGIDKIDLPVRHGEGKFYAPQSVLDKLVANGQIALRYGRPLPQSRHTDPQMAPKPPEVEPAGGEFPYNPNGSLDDIAGICDETGRVFGLMPHPEAFHHLTQHPEWNRRVDHPIRWGREVKSWEGAGMKIFRNAVDYVKGNLL